MIARPAAVTDEAATVELSFTKFISPGRLSKRYERRGGRIVKTSGVLFSTGRAERIALDAPTPRLALYALADTLNHLDGHTAIGLGVAANGQSVNPITTKRHDGALGRIARSKSRFVMPDGLNLVLADFDGLTDGRQRLIELWPAFFRVAMLTRPSASAGVCDPDTGELLVGGEHVYFIARQPGRQKEILHAIRRLAWQHGKGRLRLSKAGSVLVDGLVDTTVFGVERLIFEGRPEVVPPLTQKRPANKVDGDDLFDVDAFISHVDEVIPEAEYKRRVAAALAEPSFVAERDHTRRAFLAEWVEKGIARGLPPKRAKQAAAVVTRAVAAAKPGRLPRFTLTGDDVVVAQDGRTLSIADILARPAEFAGVALADPHEGPEYGMTTAVVMLGQHGKPVIFSHAHGGCLYRLIPAEQFGERDEAPAADEPAIEALSQRDVALVFTLRHGGRLRYCHDTGGWFRWVGSHWRQEKTKRAYHDISELAAELSAGLDDKTVKDTRKASFVGGAETIARANPQLAVTSEVWNTNPWLLGTPAGTVDLTTGKLRPADPTEGISKLTAVAPAKLAACPRFITFLQQATQQDDALIRFLRQWAGYNLTGMIAEQKLVFVYGPGGNGKGVWIAAAGGVMGSYKREAAMDTFIAARGERHPTDLAHLFGARMVTAAETSEGRAWDETRIKQITGGDIIPARFMRQDFFEYLPTFKLTFTGNHKPILRGVDDAIRRRFLIVLFTFKPATPNLKLGDELKAEWPGILRWMIDGALDWRINGLVIPPVIRTATENYFEDQDVLAEWLDEKCIVDLGNEFRKETPSALFESWADFAKRNNFDPGSLRDFGDRLEARGFTRLRSHGGRYHIGLNLKPKVRSYDPEDVSFGDAS